MLGQMNTCVLQHLRATLIYNVVNSFGINYRLTWYAQRSNIKETLLKHRHVRFHGLIYIHYL